MTADHAAALSETCYCDHHRNMHRWDATSEKYADCLHLWHDGPCTCGKFEARPLPPARFDLNGLVVR